MRPTIDADLISDLRRRVISHNVSNPQAKVKLGVLKKLYEQGYRGQEPRERGLRKVDEHLASLTKADDFEEDKHPRGKAGEFASKGGQSSPPPVGMPQARSVSEHRQLQASNPTYKAMTSDLLPERRGEVIGSALRVGASLALGGAAIAGLARGKTSGLTSKAFQWVPGKAMRYAFGIPTAGATYGATMVGRGAKLALSRRTGKAASPTTYKLAAKITAGASKAGETVGRTVGSAARRIAGGIVNSVAHAAEGGDNATGSVARKAGAYAAMGMLAGEAVNAGIRGGSLDPEKYGADYDNFSYRQIAKSAELGDVRDMMLGALAKGMDLNELRKAGLYSAAGRVALPMLAGLGGAAAGAVAGHFGGHATGITTPGEHGNPYRDKGGKFTSKENAASVVGAVAGAAAAAGGVYLALKTHNARAFVQSVKKTGAWLVGALRGVHEGDVKQMLSGAQGQYSHIHPELRAMAAGKKARIKEIVESGSSPEINALRDHNASGARYGASDPVYYKDQVRKNLNWRIADIAHAQDGFQVPHKGGMKTMSALRAEGSKAEELHAIAAKAVDAMDDAGIRAATANLNPVQAETIRGLAARRTTDMQAVDDQLASHVRAIHEAEGQHTAALATHAGAKKVQEAAMTLSQAADPVSKPAADAAHEAAKAVLNEASDASQAAIGRLRALKAGGPEINISGTKIPPRDQMTRMDTTSRLQESAVKSAAKQADAKILKHRGKLEQSIVGRANRYVAAKARLGAMAGAIPREAQASAAEVIEHAATQGKLKAELDSATVALASHGKAATPAKAAARKVVNDAQKALDAHQPNVTAAGGKLREDLTRDPSDKGFVGHAGGAMDGLKRDLGRVYSGVSTPIANLLRTPTAATLGGYASSVGSTVRDAAGSAYGQAKEAALDAVTDKVPGGRQFSPWKALASKAAVVAGAGAAGAGLDHLLEFHDHAKKHGLKEAIKHSRFDQVAIERQIDPVTGEGYVGLSAADPDNKKERVLLWGERKHSNGGGQKISQLYAGAHMSVVRNRIQEARSQQQNGNQNGNQGGNKNGSPDAPSGELREADGINGEVLASAGKAVNQLAAANKLNTNQFSEPGISAKFRGKGTDEHNEVSGKFRAEVQRVGKGDAKRGLGLVFSRHGQVMGFGQAASLLTGYKQDGSSAGDSVFTNAGFASQDKDKVAGALGEEIDKNKQGLANDANFRTNMHRAVGLIGASRQMSKEAISALHDKVRGGASPQAAPRQEPKPADPPFAKADAPQQAAQKPVDMNAPHPGRHDIDHKALEEHIQKHGPAVAKGLGASAAEEPHVLHALHGLSMMAHAQAASQGHKIGPQTSFGIVRDTIKGLTSDGPGAAGEGKNLALHELLEGDTQDWGVELGLHADKAVRRPDMHKTILLDDLDALMKLSMAPFEEGLHARLPGGTGGGQFTAGHGSGNPIVREASDALVEGTQKSSRETAGKTTAWHDPVRLGSELGTSLGIEAGSRAAGTIFNTFAPKPATLAVKGIGMLAGLAGNYVGSTAFGMAGADVGRGIHALRGTKAPAQVVSPESGIGGTLAEAAGGWGGLSLGARLGGAGGALVGGPGGAVAGAIVGGAIGNYAGGLSAKSAFNWFSGYDKPAVARVMAKHTGSRQGASA